MSKIDEYFDFSPTATFVMIGAFFVIVLFLVVSIMYLLNSESETPTLPDTTKEAEQIQQVRDDLNRAVTVTDEKLNQIAVDTAVAQDRADRALEQASEQRTTVIQVQQKADRAVDSATRVRDTPLSNVDIRTAERDRCRAYPLSNGC